MTHLITNIVEWAFVVGVVLLGLFPYLSHYRSYRTTKGMLVETGVGYCVALQVASRDRLMEIVATFCFLFLFATLMPKFGYALVIYFFNVSYLIHCAIKSGHQLGTIPANRQ